MVVLDGCLTNCCVLNSALDASSLGYHVVVAADPVAGTNAAPEGAALRIVAMHLGRVMDAVGILAAWRVRTASGAGAGARPRSRRRPTGGPSASPRSGTGPSPSAPSWSGSRAAISRRVSPGSGARL